MFVINNLKTLAFQFTFQAFPLEVNEIVFVQKEFLENFLEEKFKSHHLTSTFSQSENVKIFSVILTLLVDIFRYRDFQVNADNCNSKISAFVWRWSRWSQRGRWQANLGNQNFGKNVNHFSRSNYAESCSVPVSWMDIFYSCILLIKVIFTAANF